MSDTIKHELSVLLRISRVFLALILSITIFCILIVNQFMGSFLRFEPSSFYSSLLGVFLSVSLILLLIKDFISSEETMVKELIMLFAYIFLSIYGFFGSIIDIMRFRSCRYLYIPPMFVLLIYQPSASSLAFKFIVISIPLGVVFAIFIHSLYELIKTVTAMRIK
jgi:hypothetical protein